MASEKLYTAREVLRLFPDLHASDVIRIRGKQRYYHIKDRPDIRFTRRQAEYLPGGNLYGLNITYDAFKSLELPRPATRGSVRRSIKRDGKRVRVETGWKREVYISESALFENMSFVPHDRLVRVIIYGKIKPPGTDPLVPEDEPDFHDVMNMRTAETAQESVILLAEHLELKYYDIEQYILLMRQETKSETESRLEKR